MSDLERRVLERWPVLEIAKEYMTARAWIHFYATVAARNGIPLHEKAKKNEDSP